MLTSINPYNAQIPEIATLQKISSTEITSQLKKYLEGYITGLKRDFLMRRTLIFWQ